MHLSLGCLSAPLLVALLLMPACAQPPPAAQGRPAQKITMGMFHGCAAHAGEVACWGLNLNGQLGRGSSRAECDNRGTHCPVPAPVSGIRGAIDVAAAKDVSCAVSADGAVWCWGLDHDGMLGKTHLATTPVQIPGVDDANSVAVGPEHACAVTRAGKVICWGATDHHKLAGHSDGMPVHVSLPPARAVAVASAHSCALLEDGAVWCWGSNSFGQLGVGLSTTVKASGPVRVSGLEGIVELSANGNHSCARNQQGLVWCWGSNLFGMLGDGTTIDRDSPVLVAGISDATALSTGAFHSCAVHRDGAVSCWGSDDYGQLGDGPGARDCPTVAQGARYTCSTTPVRVLQQAVPGAGLASGSAQTCLHTADGQDARCWGANFNGEFGNGMINQQHDVPVSALSVAPGAGGH